MNTPLQKENGAIGIVSRLFPYVTILILDSLLFPVFFVATWLKIMIDALVLFALNIRKSHFAQLLFIFIVVLLQFFLCIAIYLTDGEDWIHRILVLYIIVPIWLGYLFSEKKKQHID